MTAKTLVVPDYTRDALLAISTPEALFPGDAEDAQQVFRVLARRWHPDLSTGDAGVFAHVNGLYRAAATKLASGHWDGPCDLKLLLASGRTLQIACRAASSFGLGRTIIAEDHVTYLVDGTHRDLVATAAGVNFIYASDRMRADIARCLPTVLLSDLLDDGRLLLRVAKAPDLIRLSDLQRHLGGTIEPRHTAWIISSLLNILCYLSYVGLVHHDISPDTYYIAPEGHSGALLGGWWHLHQKGARLTVVPRRTADVMPFKAKTLKTSHPLTDAELVRLLGRELLGKRTDVPEPMRRWVDGIAKGTAVDQYREWGRVLTDSFGPRRFVKLSVTAEAVYGTK